MSGEPKIDNGQVSSNLFDNLNEKPILNMIANSNNLLINKIQLRRFLAYYEKQKDFNINQLDTMTKFMMKYMEFHLLTSRHLVKNSDYLSGSSDSKYNILEIMDLLSETAFDSLISDKPLKWNDLNKKFGNGNLGFNSFMLSPPVLFCPLPESEGKLFIFREKLVQQFLAAWYQRKKCLSVMNLKKSKLIGRNLSKSVHKLSLTGDAWRMTFGLLSHNTYDYNLIGNTNWMSGLCQKDVMDMNCDSTAVKIRKSCHLRLMSELLLNLKYSKNLSCFDVVSLCIDSIYESHNQGNIVVTVDQFIGQEYLCFNSSNVLPERVFYMLSALGYLMGLSKKIYGLEIKSLNINPSVIKLLAEPLNSVSDNGLQALNLSKNPLGPIGMDILFRFFVKASSLSYVDLSDCQIGDRGLQHFVQAMMCMPLNVLKLSKNSIKDQGVAYLAKRFCYVPMLEKLDLSENLINKGAIDLAIGLKNLPHLLHLNLYKNFIDDEGTKAIAEILDSLISITQISMSQNQIGRDGAKALAFNISKSQNLREVDVTMNRIPLSDLLELKKAACNITNFEVLVESQNCNFLEHETCNIFEDEFVNQFGTNEVDKMDKINKIKLVPSEKDTYILSLNDDDNWTNESNKINDEEMF